MTHALYKSCNARIFKFGENMANCCHVTYLKIAQNTFIFMASSSTPFPKGFETLYGYRHFKKCFSLTNRQIKEQKIKHRGKWKPGIEWLTEGVHT